MGRTYSKLRIWDGVADDYLDADSITVEGERIADIGPSRDGGRDCSGLTAIPGLIDAHVHMVLDPDLTSVADQLAQDGDALREKMAVRAEAMVRAGITTARDLGGGCWLELELRDRINSGEIAGPRLLCAGQPITSVGGHCHFWGGEAADVDAARAIIRRQHEHGVDLIKLMATGGMQTPGSQPKDAQFDAAETKAIVAAANALGLHVAAHCHGTSGIDNAARAGVRTIEHCSWIGESGARAPYDPVVAAEIARREVWISPTVNAGWARFGSEFAARVTANMRGMKAAGCRLIASTDAGIPRVRHEDLAKALPVFARLAELSPLDTMKSATSASAAALELGSVTGALRPGLAADFVLVEGDPLADLGVLQAPALVVCRGREVSRVSLKDPGRPA